MDFDQWLATLDSIAAADGAVGDDGATYSQMTGSECWREVFDDGMTPDEAWSEEKYAAASMGDV